MGKIKAINISNLDGENTFYINQAILNKNNPFDWAASCRASSSSLPAGDLSVGF